MTRPQPTPEEKRISELENEIDQLKARLRGAHWRLERVMKENVFLCENRDLDPYAELLMISSGV